MKVYIKPWEEASECAKETNNFLVDTSDDGTRILGILNVSQNVGDWGHIIDANKDGKYYTGEGRYPFSYPACCVEEITPKWLEEHASKFAEETIVTESTSSAWDKDLTNYKIYRITIYKIMDGLHTYFFYVKRISYNGCEETVEDFREIK